MLVHFNLARRAFWVSAMALTVGITACQLPASRPPSAASPPAGSADPVVVLNGAGATFPAPLYQRWFSEYSQRHPEVRPSYQPIGSDAGVQQFVTGTVDFGASDVGMTSEEVAQVKRGVLFVPMTAGSIVLGYNLPDVKQGLKLSREAYTGIFLGEITNWNDPKIAQTNPGVGLPNQAINVVYRADGSGTTAIFTQHLSAINPRWENGPGSGTSIEWPVGTGTKGNEGVTAQILLTEGAIGYIEYVYAKQNKIATAALENRAGSYIEANPESTTKALAEVELPDSFLGFVPDPEGAQSYPIVTYTWLLAYQKYDDPEKAKALANLLKWGLTEGQKYSEELGYIPLSPALVTRVEAAVEKLTQ